MGPTFHFTKITQLTQSAFLLNISELTNINVQRKNTTSQLCSWRSLAYIQIRYNVWLMAKLFFRHAHKSFILVLIKHFSKTESGSVKTLIFHFLIYSLLWSSDSPLGSFYITLYWSCYPPMSPRTAGIGENLWMSREHCIWKPRIWLPRKMWSYMKGEKKLS